MQIELTPRSLIGLLCAFAGVKRLPVQGWALEVGLDVLGRHASADESAVGRALSRWPRGAGGVVPRYLGLQKLLQELVRSGHLQPEGRGWDAGYAPAEGWIAAHTGLVTALSRTERGALTKAAQALNAALTTWSKNAVASEPVGVGTI